jgi:hypothetical protein
MYLSIFIFYLLVLRQQINLLKKNSNYFIIKNILIQNYYDYILNYCIVFVLKCKKKIKIFVLKYP